MKKKERLSKLLKVHCAQCGTCCSDPIATVTHHDLHRLVKHTGKPARNLVKMYTCSDFIDEDEIEEDLIYLSYGKRIMGLRKLNERCIFLSKDRQCTVYEARPILCRTYPLELTITEENKLDEIEIREIIRDKSVSCKYTYGKRKPLKKILNYAIQDVIETDSFERKLARWNKKTDKGGKNEFLAFLGFKE